MASRLLSIPLCPPQGSTAYHMGRDLDMLEIFLDSLFNLKFNTVSGSTLKRMPTCKMDRNRPVDQENQNLQTCLFKHRFMYKAHFSHLHLHTHLKLYSSFYMKNQCRKYQSIGNHSASSHAHPPDLTGHVRRTAIREAAIVTLKELLIYSSGVRIFQEDSYSSYTPQSPTSGKKKAFVESFLHAM
ncbi:hypothetical protein AMECASPLE_021806 [Ameca splendens]|uniref:Uncharacterized protein n=1 Tax=Ameca splendens TaxID=208324 RepID=A0ABV0ZZL3_9TELE